MDSELRNGLWNAVKICVIDKIIKSDEYSNTFFKTFSQIIWIHFYKLPIDTIPYNYDRIEQFIRERFFNSQWFEVYDFIEFVANTDE